GNARALGLDAIAKNAHELEDVLDAIRKEPESPAQDRIASAGELGKKLIAEIQDGGTLFDKIVNMKDVFRVKTLDASAEIAERCERIVEQEALAAGKAVAFEFENRAGVLRGDALVRVRAMLGHMIRNAVVHGIETPDARKEKGKAIDGSIRLLMTHNDGQVRIAVEDDGAGLDQERIARHAIEQGILTQEQADVASPAEVLRLIFRPGFSTAERVTESAGRGVGLDVVEEEARALGGNVRVETKRGTFTKFIVVLPESVLEKRD
ncbi:MAG TPA: ATP-binding protein, partial [Leptospiraceae bacterium]|nr:ATP-binding protein [Leptospiraceae bacterium]